MAVKALLIGDKKKYVFERSKSSEAAQHYAKGLVTKCGFPLSFTPRAYGVYLRNLHLKQKASHRYYVVQCNGIYISLEIFCHEVFSDFSIEYIRKE